MLLTGKRKPNLTENYGLSLTIVGLCITECIKMNIKLKSYEEESSPHMNIVKKNLI